MHYKKIYLRSNNRIYDTVLTFLGSVLGSLKIEKYGLLVLAETLYQGDDTLSIKHVTLIWAPFIPATRWSCGQHLLL